MPIFLIHILFFHSIVLADDNGIVAPEGQFLGRDKMNFLSSFVYDLSP